jgi:hypothetical protein
VKGVMAEAGMVRRRDARIEIRSRERAFIRSQDCIFENRY